MKGEESTADEFHYLGCELPYDLYFAVTLIWLFSGVTLQQCQPIEDCTAKLLGAARR